MKKVRLLCIPPYEGMYSLMKNIAARRSDVELIIHMGNLEHGLTAVLENKDNNIDVIISRGGTADLIRKHINFPSCDIVISVYDVLRTIRLAQSTHEKFAVVGFPDITKPADTLRDILQYDFPVETIQSSEECEHQLQKLKELGIRIIVGDMISVTLAKNLGLQGLLIASGIESIEEAIDNAVKMHSYSTQYNRQAHLLSEYLTASNSNVIIFDSKGNKCFDTITKTNPLEEFLKQQIPNVIAQGSIKVMRYGEKGAYSVKGWCLSSDEEEYCAFSLYEGASRAVYNKNMIQYLSSEKDMENSNPLEYYLGNSERILDLRNACVRYAGMNSPVLIVGAHGTGKDRFAHYIYSLGKLKHSSMIVIDMCMQNGKSWDFLLNHDNSPLTNAGLSIYFKRMDVATPLQQLQLLSYLKNSYTAQSNRLYFSFAHPDGTEPQGELYLYLTETLHSLQIHIPSLSLRREDIPGLIGMYLNTINIQYGTRIIGLTQSAVLVLQNQPWPRNVDQLLRIVRTLALEAKTSYISEEQVHAILAREQQSVLVSQEKSIDLNRTLAEIEQDVVQYVYKAENMNQTKTAKRLGISRSTLWRMLK